MPTTMFLFRCLFHSIVLAFRSLALAPCFRLEPFMPSQKIFSQLPLDIRCLAMCIDWFQRYKMVPLWRLSYGGGNLQAKSVHSRGIVSRYEGGRTAALATKWPKGDAGLKWVPPAGDR